MRSNAEARSSGERAVPRPPVLTYAETSRDPVLLAALAAGLVSGLVGDEPGLRLRCAIGLERLTRARPELLAPHRATLLSAVSAADHPDVQWELAGMVPRLELDDTERRRALAVMMHLFDDSPFGMVAANALEAVVELAHGHPEHQLLAGRCLERGLGSPSASVRSRAWRLVARAARNEAEKPV